MSIAVLDSERQSSIAVLDSERQRRVRLVLAAALLLALAGVAIDYGLKAAESASAIVRWRGLIRQLVRGENVYNNWLIAGSFPNPPVLALVLWPLTVLPPLAAALVWFALKVGMAGCSVYWSIRLATRDGSTLPVGALAVLVLLVSRPLVSDLQHGNINILILFLTTAGLWAFRHGRDRLAGGVIALATAFKLTPALFIAYFAYKRQWRVVLASVFGLVLFLVVVPSPVLGLERNLWLLRSWYSAMIRPYVFEGRVETLQVNQSLPGIWFRLATDSPGVKLEDETVLAVNWLSLDHATAFWTLKAMIVLLLAAAAWAARTSTTDRRDWRLAWEYALVFVLMLLISERSWKHHFVTMLLPYAAIVAYLWSGGCTARRRTCLGCTLAAAFLLMASTSSELGGLLAGGDGHKFAQAYGLFGASAAVVMLALTAMLRSANSSHAVLPVGRRVEMTNRMRPRAA
jgi:hypothetical protein